MAKEKKEIITFEDVMEEINKDYGTGSIMKFSDKQQEKYEYISTDSLLFDKALGGGIILGKLYELMGWEGSGKSSICGHLCKNAQKRFPERKVIYIDSENSLDLNYFQKIGVDIDNLYIVQVNNAEQGFMITEKLINSGKVSLCIIDSDTAMQPQALIEGDMGELKMGLKARINGQVYPRLHKAISKNNTALVVVSQYREKIGIMFGNPTTTNGGHALKFTADCRIEISKSLNKEGDDINSSTVTIKAVKNRMSPPFKKASFKIDFGIGINIIEELINIGNEMEVLKKWGKTITYNDNKYEYNNFIELLETNEEFKLEIEQKVKEKLGLQ